MDRETIEALGAGREMDAAIAERVMGWTRHVSQPDPTDNRVIGGTLFCPPDMPWDSGSLNAVPQYSTDIAAAWQVVEKLVADGWAVFLERLDGGDCWLFVIGRGERINGELVDVRGPTAPLVICRAALLTTLGG